MRIQKKEDLIRGLHIVLLHCRSLRNENLFLDLTNKQDQIAKKKRDRNAKSLKIIVIIKEDKSCDCVILRFYCNLSAFLIDQLLLGASNLIALRMTKGR